MGPKAGNALQEVCVCVHEVGKRGGFLGARRWNYFCFCFFLGAGLVLGREPPRVCLDGGTPPKPVGTCVKALT